MVGLITGLLLRWRWSLARRTFLRENRSLIGLGGLWVCGVTWILLFGLKSGENGVSFAVRGERALGFSELCVAVRAVLLGISFTRRVAVVGRNPAMMLVVSFAVLIGLGTGLLMLPRTHAVGGEAEVLEWGERLRIALFTATSASCVTGLTIVDTAGDGAYWSPIGHGVILFLFQVGGLGIMTFGAIFAVFGARNVASRESVTLQELLGSNEARSARQLVRSILFFTVIAEIAGALVFFSLWKDLPLGRRVFSSLFHSVSAFCNAGFCLTEDSFAGLESRWQIWAGAGSLIILGGIGFGALRQVFRWGRDKLHLQRRHPLFPPARLDSRISLTTRLALVTSGGLLVLGTLGGLVLERGGGAIDPGEGIGSRVGHAWFQSVSFRTAGFHTVDHGELRGGTKLLAIGLMFVGASPGSTGGGVKTVCFSLVLLTIAASLRRRRRVEVGGRSVPDHLLARALAILSLGVGALMTTTFLLVCFEDRPEAFLDHLFEATSACGTVGVSAIGTANLTVASQFVIIGAMFLGRVGPLTLLLALPSRGREANYEFPEERVTLA